MLFQQLKKLLPDTIAAIVAHIIFAIDFILFNTILCYENSKKLFSLLVRGTRTWIIMLARLIVFTMLLMPGWLKLLKYYIFSPWIIRNVEYGEGYRKRNLLDVYLPIAYNPKKGIVSSPGQRINSTSNSHNSNNDDNDTKAPVIVLVSGGAWTIGYKLWSALAARGLAFLGIVTIVPDYRNFPQGDIEDMKTDIRLAVEWTYYNAHRFGGDKNKIVLAGQSAGAHICLCLIVEEFLKKNNFPTRSTVSSIPTSMQSIAGLTAENLNSGTTESSEKSDKSPNTLSNALQNWFLPFKNEINNSSLNPTRNLDNIYGNSDSIIGDCSDSKESWDSQFHDKECNPDIWREVGPDDDSGSCPSDKEVFQVTDIVKLYVGISGPYNLVALESYLHRRGLDGSILKWICRGNLGDYSPTLQLQEFADYQRKKDYEMGIKNPLEPLRNMTPVSLFHGSMDRSIPFSISVELVDVLEHNGAEVQSNVYENWTHTDSILEAPMMGNTRLFDDMFGHIEYYTSIYPEEVKRSAAVKSVEDGKRNKVSFSLDHNEPAERLQKQPFSPIADTRTRRLSLSSSGNNVLGIYDSKQKKVLLAPADPLTPTSSKYYDGDENENASITSSENNDYDSHATIPKHAVSFATPVNGSDRHFDGHGPFVVATPSVDVQIPKKNTLSNIFTIIVALFLPSKISSDIVYSHLMDKSDASNSERRGRKLKNTKKVTGKPSEFTAEAMVPRWLVAVAREVNPF